MSDTIVGAPAAAEPAAAKDVTAQGGAMPTPQQDVTAQGGATPPPQQPRPAAGDDWRAAFHGGDERVKARLERYAAPQDFMRAFLDTETRLRTGPKIDRPQENWTEEQWGAWYAELGRPEAPDKYDVKLSLPEGAELSDEVKATLGVVRDLGFKLGLSNQNMQVAQQAIAELGLEQQKALEAAGVEARARTEQQLQQEWGYDYERNVEYANAAIAQFSREVGMDAGAMLNLRLEDGTHLGSYAPFIKMMTAIGRENAQDPNWLSFAHDPGGASKTGAARVVEIMALRDSPSTQQQFNSEAVQTELARLLKVVRQEDILAAKRAAEAGAKR